jgi:hypothetical protein
LPRMHHSQKISAHFALTPVDSASADSVPAANQLNWRILKAENWLPKRSSYFRTENVRREIRQIRYGSWLPARFCVGIACLRQVSSSVSAGVRAVRVPQWQMSGATTDPRHPTTLRNCAAEVSIGLQQPPDVVPPVFGFAAQHYSKALEARCAGA